MGSAIPSRLHIRIRRDRAEERRVPPVQSVPDRVSSHGRPYRSLVWHRHPPVPMQPVRPFTTVPRQGPTVSKARQYRPSVRRTSLRDSVLVPMPQSVPDCVKRHTSLKHASESNTPSKFRRHTSGQRIPPLVIQLMPNSPMISTRADSSSSTPPSRPPTQFNKKKVWRLKNVIITPAP